MSQLFRRSGSLWARCGRGENLSRHRMNATTNPTVRVATAKATQTQHRAQEPRKNERIDADGKRPIKQVSISSWNSRWAETFVHHVTS